MNNKTLLFMLVGFFYGLFAPGSANQFSWWGWLLVLLAILEILTACLGFNS